jgi:homotetrameric cytidine deaminase
VLHQVDTYFRAAAGRLKLREEIRPDGTSSAALIPYARADEAVARTSDYRVIEIPDPDDLKAGLAATLGIDIVVDKRRHLLLHENVRIHLDDVAGLGHWVELEAVVPDGGDLTAEHDRVARLREVLGIADDAIAAEGYAQLLARHAAPPDLVDAARAAMPRAYAPYSQFAVGAALRDEHGAIHAAANVENAAYPQGQCAEASAIGILVAAGAHRITEVAVVADSPLITPCGGCRQRLAEFAQADTPVHLCGPEGARRTTTLGALLPLSFQKSEMR